MKRLVTMIGALAALGVAVLPGSAGASVCSSPSGPGASHMVNCNTWPGGMQNAMTQDLNGNGNAGMFCAVYITTDVRAPGTCSASGK